MQPALGVTRTCGQARRASEWVSRLAHIWSGPVPCTLYPVPWLTSGVGDAAGIGSGSHLAHANAADDAIVAHYALSVGK